MKFAALFAIIAIAAALDCASNQDYVKIIKKTLSWASEESFTIKAGSTVTYTSPALVNSEERELEACLEGGVNHQYTLTMVDSYPDGWSDGAWIKIESINGNVLLKAFMTQTNTESVNFSTYSPINKGTTWKYTASATGNWKDYNFGDSAWTDFIADATVLTSTGVQYYRKTFQGLTELAAFELQLKYKAGVIAYINGNEVFRDNMAAGEATSSTAALGAYTEYDFHGVIHPADCIAANSVLAVEIHPVSFGNSETIVFDGFLSQLASVESSSNCFVSPIDVTATAPTSGGFTSPANSASWSRSSYATASSTPAVLNFEFTGNVVPIVNSIRIWPYTTTTYHPSAFTFEGATSTTATLNTLMQVSSATYTSSQYKRFDMTTPPPMYRHFKFTGTASQSTSIYVNELQFMVCNRAPPSSIVFPQSQYTYLANYEEVSIAPSLSGFSNCQINPQPAAGLTFDSNTCALTGVGSTAGTVTYTVSTLLQGVSIQGSFTLTFNGCNGSMYKLERTYKYSPQYESFILYDSATQNILYQVQSGHTEAANLDWSHFICITVDRFDVSFGSTSTYWYSNSYFNMYYMISATEQELIIKGRFDNNQGNVHNVYARRPSIPHESQWSYKFDTVPANWHNNDMAGWQTATKGTFPAATNKVQLYKKIFNIGTISEVSGVYLSIRHMYGAVVYLNGVEAWRNGVTGEIGSTATATTTYTDIKYHVVTLPATQMATATVTNPQQLLKQGENVVAIALIALADTQTTSYFDAIVRLMPAEMSHSHIWEYTGEYSGMYGAATYPFNMYYGNYIYYSSCVDNELTITLDNDRREWVSSLMIQNYYSGSYSTDYPKQFKLYGRNSGLDEWTLLKDVSGISFSTAGQKKYIYFANNMPYNQFKWENFATGDPAKCSWRVQEMDLLADNWSIDIPNFTYPNTSIFKDIEMAELIPENADKYESFTINPALPPGINMDPHTGWITGTATAEAPTTTYTVSANKVIGGTVTATFTLSVEVCATTRGLMTVRFRTDSFTGENSWKLYQGRGTTGDVLQSVSSFPIASGYYYVDFCKDNGIYTLEGKDTYGDGWSTGTGYTLTVDLGEMEIEMKEMNDESYSPIFVSSVFSTYYPFQVEYTQWRVMQTNEEPAGWKDINFNDATWSEVKAAAIPGTETTTYIRKSFNINGISDYAVLNVRVKYSGGLAAYFNGNLVAIFNLPEEFDATTPATEERDASVFSKFHIVLPTAGVVEGKNVIAFEVHKTASGSSAEPVGFDATGVFGVDDCSIVLDTYASLTSTEPTAGTIENIFSFDPYITATLPNAIGTFIEWTVENLVGSRWNAFNLLGSTNVNNWSFDVYSYIGGQSFDRITTSFPLYNVVSRTRPEIPVPVALAGFRRYRWEVTDAGSATTVLGGVFPTYCKATGAVCPGIDNYPSVGEGQISPAVCPEFYSGYSYRNCQGGQLSEVKLDMCKQKLPAMVRYGRNRYTFVVGTKVTTGVPNKRNIVEKWYLDAGKELPHGLTLNAQTGEISGVPTDVIDLMSFTIYAENQSGAVAATVSIQTRKGVCQAEGVFPMTEVGTVATYECSVQGSYIGTQKRACILGTADGEWQKASGVCMPIAMIILLVIIALAVIVVVVFIVVRTGKKTKAVGGVKGKSSKKSSKSLSKKTSAKAVKV